MVKCHDGGHTDRPYVIHPYYTGRDKGALIGKDNKLLRFSCEGEAWWYIFHTYQPDDRRATRNYRVMTEREYRD